MNLHCTLKLNVTYTCTALQHMLYYADHVPITHCLIGKPLN